MTKAAEPREILLLQDGNAVTVAPTTPKITQLLHPHLHYDEKQFLRGWEKRAALREGRSTFLVIPTDMYTLDFRGRISTLAGFIPCIRNVLRAEGYSVRVKNMAPHPRPHVFLPDWTRLCGYTLRYRQDEVLLKMVSRQRGRIDCPAGYGKSFLIGLLATACYRARILITTKGVPVLHSRIYPELCGMLPDVGVLSSEGKKNLNARVLCCSAGMLHHVDDNYDFLIADEVHELGADCFAESLIRFHRARYFGLSASHNMRSDGKDPRLEGLFGPIIMTVSRQEACERELIVPIVVQWRDVYMTEDPSEGYEDVEKLRRGIWRNEYRNSLIAEDARSFDADVQTLATVGVLEHAAYLKRLLPEYQLVYRPGQDNSEAIQEYQRRGMIPKDEPVMTEERRAMLQEDFEKGSLRKVIATTVWNVGVDFRQCSALIRCGAGGGGDRDIQLPGRVSRLYDGKEYGMIRDYLDQFNRGFRRQARERSANYEMQGFEQRFPAASPKSALHRKLFHV